MKTHEFIPHPYNAAKCGKVNDKGVVCAHPASADCHACQKCGKVGGKVVSFDLGGLSTSRWVCPHCLDNLHSMADEMKEALLEVKYHHEKHHYIEFAECAQDECIAASAVLSKLMEPPK